MSIWDSNLSEPKQTGTWYSVADQVSACPFVGGLVNVTDPVVELTVTLEVCSIPFA